MWQGPGPSVHSWHTVGTQSVQRKTEGADGCAVARRCPFPPGAPPSGRAGRGGRQGRRIETSRMWTAKPSLFAQRVYPFTVERAEDRRRRKRSARLLGRRTRARPPGAWGGHRDVSGTCPSWGAPCPALSLQSPQADVIPPPRKDPTHRAQSWAAPASPSALLEAPGGVITERWAPFSAHPSLPTGLSPQQCRVRARGTGVYQASGIYQVLAVCPAPHRTPWRVQEYKVWPWGRQRPGWL